MYSSQSIPGDGDAFVDRGIESEIIVLGLTRGDRSYPVQVDDVFAVALHEWWVRELFGKFVQALDGAVGLFTFGADEGVAFVSFEVKDGVDLDEINRAVWVFYREFFEYFSHCD